MHRLSLPSSLPRLRTGARALLPVLLASPFLLLAACADDPTGAQLGPSGELVSQQMVGNAALVPNAVPYREAGYAHGTGRDGGASLAARALLGQDGRTVLEVTTGELSSASPPPAPLQQLQLKFLDAETLLRTEVHGAAALDGAGEVVLTYPSLARHWTIRIQGNVRTGNVQDRDRTGVVTVEERVNLRPDPALEALVVTKDVQTGDRVPVGVDVVELNGDLGARYDLALYVDGTEVDRIENALVQEADRVSHVFAGVTFEEAGTHDVEVRIHGVTPGDWDVANNSAAATVTARPAGAEPFESASVGVLDEWRQSFDNEEGSWSYFDKVRGGWERVSGTTVDRESSRTDDVQQFTISLRASGLLSFPLSLEVGGDLEDLTVAAPAPTWTETEPSGDERECYYEVRTRSDGNTPAVFVNLCMVDYASSTAAEDRISATAISYSGEVVYLSRGFREVLDPFDGGYQYYDLNVESAVDYGGTLTEWPDGPLHVSVRLSGADRTLAQELEIPLTRSELEVHLALRRDAYGNTSWEHGAEGDCSDPVNWFSWDVTYFDGDRELGEHCFVRHFQTRLARGYAVVEAP